MHQWKPKERVIPKQHRLLLLKKKKNDRFKRKAIKTNDLLTSLSFYNLDDEDFQLTLSELEHGSINFDPERLASLKFNPLLTSSQKNFSLCNDLDPDFNFYSQSFDCEYYTEGSFNDYLAASQSHLNLNNNGNFSVLHLNIRSISRKLARQIFKLSR